VSQQTWEELLASAPIDGAALANTVTPTSILPAAAKITLPANSLRPGSMLRVRASGRISNIITTPGTLTLDIRFGAIVVANGGAMALNTVAKTNVPWMLEWLLTVRAIGSGTTANLIHQGLWTSEAVVGSSLPDAGSAGSAMLPNAAPAVGNGFDSTTAQLVDLFATWSIANAGNSLQLHQFGLEAMN
jgi:hypothetical protein